MKGRTFINKIIIGLWLTCAMTLVHAGEPLWRFAPLTATTLTVAANSTASVRYEVTNQSGTTYTLAMRGIPGVTQITTPGNCPNPFVLDDQQSCILNLSINGSALNGNIEGGPIVCSQDGNPNQCYQPSSGPGFDHILHIIKGPAAAYTVGGSVFGLSGTLVLENNGSDALTLNADGTFSFSNALPPGSTYSVTVQSQPATQTCTVTNGSGTITDANISNVTVNCSTNTRTVGGNVLGLTASQSVVLQNNGEDNLTVNANGSFTFPTSVVQGSSYSVTILTQPTTQTCTVNNGNGIVGASNITTVEVSCSTNTHTVGGNVSGLSAGTVVLQNNGGDNLPITSNGPFTFVTAVAEGASYSVTVLTQPLGQTCVISDGSGTMAGTDVTSVVVECNLNTATLGVSVDHLALSVTGLTEYGVSGTPPSGLPRKITITNSGSTPTVNLSVNQPTWPAGTTLTTTCTSILGAGNNCEITITPGPTATSDNTNPCSVGTAPNPGVIEVSANNAASVSTDVVVLDYGCIYQGGYVYAFDDSPADSVSVSGKVVTISDQAAPSPNGIIWSSNGGTGGGAGGFDPENTSNDLIPGIGEGSTPLIGQPSYGDWEAFFTNTYTNPNPFIASDFSMCFGNLDGSCNTGNILKFYNQFITNNKLADGVAGPFTADPGPTNIANYAAGLCKQTIAGSSDWYLPAICEMGYGSGSSPDNCGTLGAPALQNIQSSLIDSRGFSTLSGLYWSSTWCSINTLDDYYVWEQSFASDGTAGPACGSMTAKYAVRCVREFTP